MEVFQFKGVVVDNLSKIGVFIEGFAKYYALVDKKFYMFKMTFSLKFKIYLFQFRIMDQKQYFRKPPQHKIVHYNKFRFNCCSHITLAPDRHYFFSVSVFFLKLVFCRDSLFGRLWSYRWIHLRLVMEARIFLDSL